MNKNSTLFYQINNFEPHAKQLVDVDQLFNHRESAPEICEVLDKYMQDPPNHVVETLLNFARGI